MLRNSPSLSEDLSRNSQVTPESPSADIWPGQWLRPARRPKGPLSVAWQSSLFWTSSGCKSWHEVIPRKQWDSSLRWPSSMYYFPARKLITWQAKPLGNSPPSVRKPEPFCLGFSQHNGPLNFSISPLFCCCLSATLTQKVNFLRIITGIIIAESLLVPHLLYTFLLAPKITLEIGGITAFYR